MRDDEGGERGQDNELHRGRERRGQERSVGGGTRFTTTRTTISSAAPFGIDRAEQWAIYGDLIIISNLLSLDRNSTLGSACYRTASVF